MRLVSVSLDGLLLLLFLRFFFPRLADVNAVVTAAATAPSPPVLSGPADVPLALRPPLVLAVGSVDNDDTVHVSVSDKILRLYLACSDVIIHPLELRGEVKMISPTLVS